MSNIIEGIAVNKQDLIDTFNNFLDDINDGLFIEDLNATYEKIKPYLEKRFVKMNDNLCFDSKITACWVGLCDEDFPYLIGWDPDYGNSVEKVLEETKKFYEEEHIKLRDNVDLPTKNELSALTDLTEAPFSLFSGAPEKPSNWILAKNGDKVYGFRAISGCVYENIKDYDVRLIYRLYKEDATKVTDKEKFILWIVHKLKPVDFHDTFYEELLKWDIKIKWVRKTTREVLTVVDVDTHVEVCETPQIEEENIIDIEPQNNQINSQQTQQINNNINNTNPNINITNQTQQNNTPTPQRQNLNNIQSQNPTTQLDTTNLNGVDSQIDASAIYGEEDHSLEEIPDYISSGEELVEFLRMKDYVRARITPYEKRMFFDINKGSWEVTKAIKEKFDPLLQETLVIRDAREDIVEGGVVGIDFGTKSTVVVVMKDGKIKPLRVGIGDYKKEVEPEQFENPTIVEFFNFEQFLEDYLSTEHRPYTKWDDVKISHEADSDLENKNTSDVNAFVKELKQWAGDSKRKIKIKDKMGHEYNLGSFLEYEGINPIEVYAYYLGLFINNQYNGIFLEYLLSFPVTYELKVRKKILESFERGLRRSIPFIGRRIEDFVVKAGVSEPAAYAAIAIEESLSHVVEEKGKIFYSIFDFGGGTTDFDFGVFKLPNESEDRYDWVIEHFGAGGEKFLGGENLLESLAFFVFKNNAEKLRGKFTFTKPPFESEFIGSEVLISDTEIARKNTINLIKELRPFWERTDFSDRLFEDGIVRVDLVDENENLIAGVELEVDEDKLLDIINERILRGVEAFFENLKEVLANNKHILLDVDEMYILLAGNASKSPFVKEIFDKKMKSFNKILQKENVSIAFHLIPPLDNHGNYFKPNGKTGVAFGLVESREGGRVAVYDKNQKGDEIKFKYYLGRNKRKKFIPLIDRETEYNKWIQFVDAGSEYFEVFYTTSSLAGTYKLDITDETVKIKRLKIRRPDKNKYVYIRLISSDEFKYGVGIGENIKVEGRVKL
ncbi:MAG: hypothetical protein DSY40_03690 [Nautilia sp.]|nr:MAG: hypothetical protein DSY40_03690 [Nautilia sp.]